MEEKEFENQRRDLAFVVWLGKNLLPYALLATLIGVVLYFMRAVGT